MSYSPAFITSDRPSDAPHTSGWTPVAGHGRRSTTPAAGQATQATRHFNSLQARFAWLDEASIICKVLRGLPRLLRGSTVRNSFGVRSVIALIGHACCTWWVIVRGGLVTIIMNVTITVPTISFWRKKATKQFECKNSEGYKWRQYSLNSENGH